jgi:hypothetical protein
MSLREEVKKTVVDAVRKSNTPVRIRGKRYRPEDLINEIVNETDTGKEFLDMVIEKTIKRYGMKLEW